ncbi:MAG: nucleoside triphosphate pyrophosphohydrolase [Alphaproteobacteria bacterium]|nr:nucleoside triphosphate pyrophosphohydrolase [Alphaproteobacteria bacterium]
MSSPKAGKDIQNLIAIMAALRTPQTGCPWDLEQSFETIAPYTIEEAYEVIDAIERGDMVDLKDELGDLLLQVVFYARIAEEAQLFAFPDVVEAITKKLIRRHPHVFGDLNAHSPQEVKMLWDDIKAQEKAERRTARKAAGYVDSEASKSVLAGVPEALPALTRAEKIQSKASKVGFDWNDPLLVLDKIEEETAEIKDAMASGSKAEITEEVGDLLFAVVNLARHLKVDPEQALRLANSKFTKRFNYIEAELDVKNKPIKNATLDEMEALWHEAKTRV